jgi:hypothetical protein
MSPDAFSEAMMAAIVRTVEGYYGKGGQGFERRALIKPNAIKAAVAAREELPLSAIACAIGERPCRVYEMAKRTEHAARADLSLADDLSVIESHLREAVHAAAGAVLMSATVRSAA